MRRWSEDHGVLVALGIGIVLAAVTWPTVGLYPQGGIDQSWQAALAMAAHQAFGAGAAGAAAPAGLVAGGAAFGSRIQFTYGPLAFLTYGSLWYPGLAVAATVWTALVRVAVMASLVWSLRRSFSLGVATALAWVAGVAAFLIVTPEPLEGLAVIWCLVAVRGELPRRWQGPLVLALGGFAGVTLLVKFSVGLVALVLAIVATLTGPARRSVNCALALAGFLVALVITWVATDNSIGLLVPWIVGSVHITTGYSAGMGLELPALAGDYWRAALVTLVVLAAAAWEMRSLRGVTRWGVGLLSLGILAAAFKEGFVRHNLHSLIFFGVAAMALAGLRPLAAARWPANVRRGRDGAGVAKAALGTGLALVALLGFDTALFIPRTNVNPLSALRALAHQTSVLSSTRLTSAVIAKGRALMQASYGLTPAQVALVSGRTTWVYPWEEALAWAYPTIAFDPPPIFQTYSVYTPTLDHEDARFLASASGPERVLVQPDLALDNQYPPFAPPATEVALMCNYVQADATSSWEVLAKVASRCGRPQLIATVHTGWDHSVSVPQPPSGEAILARWAPLPTSLAAHVVGLLLRPPIVNVQLKTATRAGTYKLVTGTASDQHLVVPPSTLGWTGPYVPLDIRQLRLSGGDLGRSSSGVSVSFYAVRVSAPPAGGGASAG